MHGELSGAVTAYPNGVCAKHNAVLLTKNGRPICLMCDREQAKALATPMEVNQAEDPGHEALKDLLKQHVREIIPETAAKPKGPAVFHSAPQPVVDFKEHLAVAIEHLKKAPMPKNIVQFKAVQRAIALLEKITGEV